MRRTTGVTILAVVDFVSGFLGTAGACVLISVGVFGFIAWSDAGTREGIARATNIGAIGALTGVMTVILSFLSFAMAIGLFQLKEWARMASVVLSIIVIILSTLLVIAAAALSWGLFVGPLLGIVINILVVYYLDQPSVKRVFGKM